jgi:hypothetical protein
VVAGSRRGLRWRREAYLTTLTEWAQISRGAFAPEEIVERWHSEEGPADIEFVVGGAAPLRRPPQTCATTS